eukprot:216961-Pelagomonas_calceolata.AAC.1
MIPSGMLRNRSGVGAHRFLQKYQRQVVHSRIRLRMKSAAQVRVYRCLAGCALALYSLCSMLNLPSLQRNQKGLLSGCTHIIEPLRPFVVSVAHNLLRVRSEGNHTNIRVPGCIKNPRLQAGSFLTVYELFFALRSKDRWRRQCLRQAIMLLLRERTVSLVPLPNVSPGRTYLGAGAQMPKIWVRISGLAWGKVCWGHVGGDLVLYLMHAA